MNKSESIINISKALSEFQSNCPVLSKGSQGYGYKYADLPSIVSTINPIMKKSGLCFTQLTGSEEGKVSVTTILIHAESGEFFETTISSNVKGAAKMSEIQAAGSIITYLRRYSLSAILGIVTDEDADGHFQKPSINALLQEVNLCTTKEQLKSVWDSYPDFHSTKEFSNLVAVKNKSFGGPS
jgi:hypothetical protein